MRLPASSLAVRGHPVCLTKTIFILQASLLIEALAFLWRDLQARQRDRGTTKSGNGESTPSGAVSGFEVLSGRWGVERIFAWLGRCRRLAKDRDKSIASTEAWIDIAHIRLTTRRLARA